MEQRVRASGDSGDSARGQDLGRVIELQLRSAPPEGSVPTARATRTASIPLEMSLRLLPLLRTRLNAGSCTTVVSAAAAASRSIWRVSTLFRPHRMVASAFFFVIALRYLTTISGGAGLGTKQESMWVCWIGWWRGRVMYGCRSGGSAI